MSVYGEVMEKISETSAYLYKQNDSDEIVRLMVAMVKVETANKAVAIMESLKSSMARQAFCIASDCNRRLGVVVGFEGEVENVVGAHMGVSTALRVGLSITMLIRPEFLVQSAIKEKVMITSRLMEVNGEYTISASTEEDHWWQQFIK